VVKALFFRMTLFLAQFSPIFDGQNRVAKTGSGLPPADAETWDYSLVRPEDAHTKIAA
jgi:hypothetical protein